MTLRKKVLSMMVAGALTGGFVPVLSAEESLAEQVQAAEKDASKTPPSPFFAVSEVDRGDDLVMEFLDARGWIRGQSASNPGGGTIVVVTQAIAADPSTIEFSEARILATEEAFLQAMGELVSQDAVNIGKTMADRFLQDNLPEEVRDTTSLDALGKAVAGRAAELTVQGLNSLLEELGVDPSEMPELTIAERKDRLYDEFVTDTTWKAMGKLSGIGVFAVIQDVGGEGVVNNGTISVVVGKADRFSEIANQLRTGNVVPGQAIPTDDIQARLKPHIQAKEPMLGYFGVQPMRDEQGRFGLVAFGIAAPQLVRGAMEEYQITAELEAARSSAQLMADGYLAQFAAMTVEGQKEETKRKLLQEVQETRGNGRTEIKKALGIGRMINEVLKSSASARLQGVQTIGQWNAVDPGTGHPYLGYVKYWSPMTSAKAQGLNEQPKPSTPATENQQSQPSTKRSTRVTGPFGEW